MQLQSAISAYTPQIVQRHFKEPEQKILLEGMLLLTDISGFTRLTEALAQRGPEGIEQLTQILNRFFGRILDQIAAKQGDVLKFAGDALLVFWPLETETPQTIVENALACALALFETMEDFRQERGLDIFLKTSLGWGEICLSHIGGVSQAWFLVLEGEALQEVAWTLSYAQPNEILFAPNILTKIPLGIHQELRPEGFARFWGIREKTLASLSAQAYPAISPINFAWYLPLAVKYRLEAEQTDWLAELREVTVLFIHPQFKTGAPELQDWQALLQMVQSILQTYEGTINKLNQDEKGLSLLIALGLPPLAHQDDSLRGITAALEIWQRLRKLNCEVSVGVTTGRVFCGEIGNAWRREYTLMGDIVNIAARLMQTSQGQILCDHATYQATCQAFVYQIQTPLQLKGKEVPVAVYHPVGILPSETQKPRAIFGRELEQNQLEQALSHLVTQKTGQILKVEGEAGIGKTCLLNNFAQSAQTQAVKILKGSGEPTETNTLYHAWKAVFLGFLPPEPQALWNELQVAIPQEWQPWLPLLNEILDTDFPETDISKQLQGETRSDNLHRLLLRLLQREAQKQPLVLILDDVHWLDSASIQLTEKVWAEIQPLLLILGSRPIQTATAELTQPKLFASQALQILALKPLKKPALEKLIAQKWGVKNIDPALLEMLQKIAEGHPFFCEELLQALQERELLEIQAEGVWLLDPENPGVDFQIPRTIEGLITSRIDKLEPLQQLLLKVASVVGRTFSYHLLYDIFPLPDSRPRLQENLALLSELDLTHLDAPYPEWTYTFKHNLTHQVAYNLMLFEQRQELHCAVADWYEAQYPEHLAHYYELLAYHWQRGKVNDKAFHYLLLAGEKALKQGIYLEAKFYLKEALVFFPRSNKAQDHLTHAHLLQQLGETHYGLGEFQESKNLLFSALQMYGWPFPEPQTLKPELFKALLRQLILRLLRFWPHSKPVQAELHFKVIATLDRLGQLFYLNNQRIEGLCVALFTLNLAEQIGPSPALARASANICLISSFMGFSTLAKFYRKQALELTTQYRDPYSRAWVLQLTNLSKIGAADWSEIDRHFQEALDIYALLGHLRLQNECLGLWSFVAFCQGHYQTAHERTGKSLALARQRGDLSLQIRGLTALARLHLVQGQLADGLNWALKAKTLCYQEEDRGGQLNALAIYLRILLQQNDRAEVESIWQEFDKRFGAFKQTMTFFDIEVYTARVEYFIAQEQSAPLQSALQDLKRFASKFKLGWPRYCYFQALVLAKKQQTGLAQKWRHQGLALARQLQLAYEIQLLSSELISLEGV